MKKQNVLDVLIVGAGQSGLASAYYIKQRKLSFLLVDAHKRIGDSWRNRYDSLKLLTPNTENSLPGMPIDKHSSYATKNEFANYLERYAKTFRFPIELETTIEELSLENGTFVAKAQNKEFFAKRVVVATGAFQEPFIQRDFTKNLGGIFFCHSATYKNPKQIPKGKVLVVGAGNSGAQIASELAKTHDVVLSSRRRIVFGSRYDMFYIIAASLLPMKQIQKIIDFFSVRKVFVPELESLLKNKKVILKPEVKTIKDNRVYFTDGTSDSFANIIFATGFTFDFDWIFIKEAFNSNHKPIAPKGVSVVKGLYFVYHEKDAGFIRDLDRRVKYIVDVLEKQV